MSTPRTRARRAAGFSLVELLVSMVIALVVTLAISSVLIRSEGSKRTSTSVNDVNQAATYLSYSLDRTVRSAGSGFTQSWLDAFGCTLDAAKGGVALLPLPSAAPAPFNNVPLDVRLAPVMIGKGLADSAGQVRGDVLTVIAGTSGGADLPQKVRTSSVVTGPPATLRVTNSLGYADNDLVLLADPSVPVPGVPGGGCMLQQVATAGVSGDQLTFTGSDYSRNVGSVVSLASFGGNTTAIQLGSIPAVAGAPANPPQMLMIGVDNNNTLTSYDLLSLPANALTPLADGVIEMRALYGVDTSATADNVLDAWIDPVAGSGYTTADLRAGTAIARGKLRRIVAVRIGLILRTALQERVSERYYGQYPANTDPTTLPSTTLTLFSDLPAGVRQTRTIVGADNLYRYRTIEFTVPLRNSIYATIPPAGL